MIIDIIIQMVFKKFLVFLTEFIMIIKLPDQNFAAPAKTASIIGGYVCKSRKPYITNYMIYITEFWGYPICGATLLNPKFVLTAAHCDKEVSMLYASNAYDRATFVNNRTYEEGNKNRHFENKNECKVAGNLNLAEHISALIKFGREDGLTLLSRCSVAKLQTVIIHNFNVNLTVQSESPLRIYNKYLKENGCLSWMCPVIRIIGIFHHPNFCSKTLLNDIAIMKLQSPIEGNVGYVRLPVPYIEENISQDIINTSVEFIPVKTLIFEEEEEDDITSFCPEATVVGWGTTSKENYYIVPKQLMCIELRVIPRHICTYTLREARAKVGKNSICALGQINEDSCVGDSGGPLLCGRTQYGITSWGPDCGVGLPAVYTRVDKYLTFINETIMKNRQNLIFYSKILVLLCLFICRSLNKNFLLYVELMLMF